MEADIANSLTLLLITLISAINPFIYASRIHRFRLRVKRILHLKIGDSDKYERYEIRQKFIVRKDQAMENNSVNDFTDSGVCNMNDAFMSDDNTAESTELHCTEIQQDRPLSCISESPENISPACLVANAGSVTDTALKQPTAGNLYQGRCYRKSSLTITSTREVKVVHQRHKSDILSTSSNYYSDLAHASGNSRHFTSTSTFKRSSETSANHADVGGILLPEPIAVDCDSQSEYLTLVVKRIVCSYDDSDTDDDGSNRNQPQPKSIKTESQEVEGSSTSQSTEARVSEERLSYNPMYLSPGTPKYEYTAKKPKRGHSRSHSSCSVASMTVENDQLSIEVCDRRKKPAVSPLPSPRPKNSGSQAFRYDACDDPNPHRDRLNIFRGLVEGTLSRIRRQGRRVSQELTRNIRTEKMLSRSTEDLANSDKKAKHPRSRSEIVADVDYSLSTDLFTGCSSIKPPGQRGKVLSIGHRRLADSSDPDLRPAINVTPSSLTQDNQIPSRDLRTANEADSSSPSWTSLTGGHQRLEASQSLNSSTSQSAYNNMILPLKFLLPDGAERHVYLTKDSIYQAQQPKKHREGRVRTVSTSGHDE